MNFIPAALFLKESYTAIELLTVALLVFAIIIQVAVAGMKINDRRKSARNPEEDPVRGDSLWLNVGVTTICLFSLWLNLTP